MRIRDLVMAHVNRLQKVEDMHAGEASEILVELSALMGNVTTEIQQAQKAYTLKLIELLDDSGMPVAKAKILAEGTDEWDRLETAKGLEKVIIETSRSLKYYIRVKGDEKELSY